MTNQTTDDRRWDALFAGLAALRAHDVSPDRVERTRQRCLATLARRHAESRSSRVFGRHGWLEPALALGLSAVYLAIEIGQTLALRR